MDPFELRAMHSSPAPHPGSKPCLIPLIEAATFAFMATQYHEPRFHFVWHYHPEHELVWIRRGCGMRFVGTSAQPFEAGDLVLLPPQVPHAWASGTEQADGAKWSVLHFLPEHWGSLFWQLPEAAELRRLFTEAARGVRFTGPNVWSIGETIEQLAQQPTHSLGSLIQFLKICELLISTPHEYLNASPEGTAYVELDPRMQRVLEWIRARLSKPITQAETAAHVGMSPAAFSRWFKGHTGLTFQTYLNQLRIAHVCSQLADGEKRITQIAFASGFSNLANFNRRFLQVMGITPTAFRSQSQSAQQQSAYTYTMRLGLLSAIRLVAKPKPRQRHTSAQH